MNWIVIYHIIQVVLGLGFIFTGGIWFAKRHYWVSVLNLVAGAVVLLAEGTSFLAFLGRMM